MTNNYPVFQMKWEHNDADAAQIITDLEQHLDKRKKGLKNPEQNRALLAGILAYRGGPFKVLVSQVPDAYKATLEDALECLKGPVLLSLGRNTYQVRDDYAFLKIRGTVRTKDAVTTEIETKWGAIYRDNTHHEVAFGDIGRFGYVKPSLVRVVAPHKHWAIAFGEEPTPSVNWIEIQEQATQHPRHDELMDAIVEQGRRRGVAFLRYGEDSFVCKHPEQVAFWCDLTLTMTTGRHGLRPLLEFTDMYGRKDKRWGSRA
ncbi:hypothetical protein [Yoonia sp.]|uniref:hypothetical protein n=1 Tax=Yoonia sp. TaxID=2212373 RepID=UPI0040476A7C